MNISVFKLTILAVSFLLLFILGYWLTRLGKPYSQVLFNVHKLIALGIIISIGFLVYRSHQLNPLQSFQITFVLLTLVFFITTIITGGLQNLDKTPSSLRLAHHILPYLTLITSAGTVYFLLLAGKLIQR